MRYKDQGVVEQQLDKKFTLLQIEHLALWHHWMMAILFRCYPLGLACIQILPLQYISYHCMVCKIGEQWSVGIIGWGVLSGSVLMPLLSNVLNPGDLTIPEEVDVSYQLELLVNILSQPHPSRVPLNVRDSLDIILGHFKNLSCSSSQLTARSMLAPASSPMPPVDVPKLNIEWFVKLNYKTTLEILYTYGNLNSVIEYPETCKNRSIGHLFAMDPKLWINPSCNFIYSLGAPWGSIGTINKPKTCPLLVDNDRKLIPCKISHSTYKYFSQLYQNVNLYPVKARVWKSAHSWTTPKLDPTPWLLERTWLSVSKIFKNNKTSPLFVMSSKRLLFISQHSSIKVALPHHTNQQYIYTGDEAVACKNCTAHQVKEQHGHSGKETCNRWLLFRYTASGQAFVQWVQ